MLKIKILSIIVPAYNSQDYLNRCLDTLIQGGSDVEVIVVDDGSTDRTAEVARKYCALYPDIVWLEQKENGGHGSAINRGLKVAKGTYFKVVDSDDWLNVPAYHRVLDLLKNCGQLDLLITNYVYEYFYTGSRYAVHYRNVLSEGKVFTWKQVQKFRISQLLLMHSMIYRTELLRKCALQLPEHTFYVDNLYAYQPLPFVQKMMYLDCDLYRYFIGREDQSVNTANMIKRIDQQLRVTKIMVESYNVYKNVQDKNLRRYMLHYQSMMVAISVIHIILSKKEENYQKIEDLWMFIKNYDEKTYYALRRSIINILVSLPGRSGRYIARKGFKIAKKIYKFS